MRTDQVLYAETKRFFDQIENVSDKWDDAASEDFKDAMLANTEKVAYSYAEAQSILVQGFDNYLNAAEQLLNWKSGIELINLILHPFSTLKMLFHQQFSRVLTGRDYHFR